MYNNLYHISGILRNQKLLNTWVEKIGTPGRAIPEKLDIWGEIWQVEGK